MTSELGLGLLSIGRPWGIRRSPPPSEEDALRLLSSAVDLGIRWFDTAPAYGSSEAILGTFLRGCDKTVKDRLILATKMGEQWSGERDESFVDHSYDALCRSIDNSIQLLGRVDLLQVHKATCEVLASKDLRRALRYAESSGIQTFGASVKDAETARFAAEELRLAYVQMPFNLNARELEAALEDIQEKGCRVLVNRPAAMGQLLEGAKGGFSHEQLVGAFEFILRHLRKGVILTGTGSAEHLAQNVAAFQDAMVLCST